MTGVVVRKKSLEKGLRKKTQNQKRQGSLLKVVKVDGFEIFLLEAFFSFFF